MAARIVYKGAAGGGGNLFEGKKIWLSHRVPMRTTFKEQVESNGGVVVALDKNADIIIVDHARRDCPSGSISWTWIQQSIKNGRLENIEDHRAGPTHAQIREVGSGQPTKKTRTPFSAEDDRILMEWVTRAERKGLPIMGNALYQQLAEKYPHHTWQSWLDRWKRYVSGKKRPLLEDKDEDEENDLEPMAVPPKPRQPRNQPSVSRSIPRSAPRPSIPPSARSRPTPQPKLPTQDSLASPVASKRSHNSTKSLKANPFILKSPGGDFFTNEETELLFDAYDAIMDLSDDLVIDAWIAWSMENPNHTPQEWRNYFKEYVVPTNKARLESKKGPKQSKEMPPPKRTPIREPSSNATTAITSAINAPEIKDSQGSSGQTVQTPAKEDENDSYTNSPGEFERNLLILADSLELEVDPSPIICGKMITLFELWQVVHLGEFGGYDEVTGRRLWRGVAQKLGYDGSTETQAGKDLKVCYAEILCDLENAEKELREGEDITSSQAADLIADQLRQTAEQPEGLDGEEEYYSSEGSREDPDPKVEYELILREQEENDDDLDYVQITPHRPRPPPPPSTGKRVLGSDRGSFDLPYNKRQRIDKGKGKEQLEIPSTPEDVINNTQMRRPAHQPSPLKCEQAEPSSPSADSSINDIQPIKLEHHRPSAPQHLEPETQDFYHPTPTHPQLPEENLDDDEDEVIPGSIHRPPDELADEEEESMSTKQEPPSPPDYSTSRRNFKNSTSRDTLHSSSNNVSNATTRGTLHSSNNNYDSSTQSQSDSQIEAELIAFMENLVTDGYAREIVIEGLEATTFMVKEALPVIDSLANGDGIPEDVPGVWTSWDDEALKKGRGTAEYDGIVRKHGISRIKGRKEFKRELETAEEK
ncbi:hypothetical protein IFR05_006418 [Cadophora sp. M221]|nr:hypothetical protein IFR05_006418 [Cadophora sp. M221]